MINRPTIVEHTPAPVHVACEFQCLVVVENREELVRGAPVTVEIRCMEIVRAQCCALVNCPKCGTRYMLGPVGTLAKPSSK